VLLFLDTEYTSSEQREPNLISLALVAEDGKRELYLELADWTLQECNSFVIAEVIPLLSGPALSTERARASAREWLNGSPRKVQIACDSERDWQLLLKLLGTPLPPNLAASYFDLRPLVDTTIYHRTVVAFYDNNSRAHHALFDARAYRTGWLAWMDAKKGL
jgi:hypothetical protein